MRNCLRPPNITPFTFATDGSGPVSTSFPSSRGGVDDALRSLRSDIGREFYRSAKLAERLGNEVAVAGLARGERDLELHDVGRHRILIPVERVPQRIHRR